MGSIGRLLDAIDRLIASAFGSTGNTFGESKTLREQIANEKQQEDQEGKGASDSHRR